MCSAIYKDLSSSDLMTIIQISTGPPQKQRQNIELLWAIHTQKRLFPRRSAL